MSGDKSLRTHAPLNQAIGAPGFEPGTSSPPDWRANQAAPRPVAADRSETGGRSSGAAFERQTRAEADQDAPRDAVERPLDPRSNEDVSPSRGDRGVGEQPDHAHRVEEQAEQVRERMLVERDALKLLSKALRGVAQPG